MSIIPYARPDVRADDIDAVVSVLKSQFLTTGPKVPELEDLFGGLVNAREAVACSNGTTALHLACLALDLKAGDKVIVPALTFLATANAVRMCGADVVFCDVDPDTGIMRLKDLQAIDPDGVVAVFPVHIGGYCADMKAISEYARKQGWKIVEDACHALGGTNQGQLVGSCSYSDMACFSLHATKCFSAAEGGMVTTNDHALADKMRTLRNHGMERDPQTGPWAYTMSELGYNYRLTDVQAALAISQLGRMDEVRNRRADIVERYKKGLCNLSAVVHFVPAPDTGGALLHLCQVLIDFETLGKSRSELMQELMHEGVGTQVHYMPVAHQPYYMSLYGQQTLPGSDHFYNRVLALPLYSALSDEDVEKVIVAMQKVISQ